MVEVIVKKSVVFSIFLFLMLVIPVDMINGTLLSVRVNESSTSMSNECDDRPWRVGNDCRCADSLDGVVLCDPSGDVFIQSTFCMSIDGGEEVVGRCPYSFLKYSDLKTTNIGLYYKVPNNTYQLEHALCDRLNRYGLLCGRCKDGFGHSVYPFFDDCVDCPRDRYSPNWALYVFLSFGPLTVLLMIIVCLRVNAASAPLNAFVFISQVITQPPLTRGFVSTIKVSFLSEGGKIFLRLLFSLYGIWNLDFFISIIPSFCVPFHNAVYAILFTYLIALYPLVVLVILYVCIELHSRGVRVIVWLWRPLYPHYVRFRRHCDIRASVIDAFVTFFLLSYMKILFLSFDFFAFSYLKNKDGSTVKIVSYFDAGVVISSEPKPVIILSMLSISFILLFFTLLPLVLILLYPCGFCQKCLTYCKVDFQSLHFFMNAFNGHFKDGTEGTFDCRFFAAIFLFIRILISVEYVTLYFNYHTSVITTCTALAIAIAVVQPYRKKFAHFNRLDPLTIFLFICWLVSYKDIHRAAGTHLSHQRISMALNFISLILPLILFSALILKKTLLKIFSHLFHRHTSDFDEYSLEQRSHCPHVSQIEYVKAECLP